MPRPFRYLEPTFFAGLFDDPLLLVRIRPTGRALLFDCGKVHHLAKRVFTSIDAVFISHAHMDHFMGMDSVIRHSHASPRTVQVFGPPGISARMANKFACYDWNLADSYWGNFRVTEVGDAAQESTLYLGPKAFGAQPDGFRTGAELYTNRFLTVAAARCEHRIPVLAYKVTEGEAFVLDERLMALEGVVKGDWLRDLERLFRDGAMEGAPIAYPRQVGDCVEEYREPDAAALYRRIKRDEAPASIGYVTDVGFSQENMESLVGLLRGVDLLVCECAFLAADREKAAISRHLCTTELNMVLDRLRPHFVLPMHLSKSYQALGGEALYRELELPEGATLLRIPDRLTPRPILESEVPNPLKKVTA
ncbi:ribonuclease Z [Geomonas silvestris]|uniref:Ribonuclease Z n=1 Tax=Geomonas silvestris TaxID=2740184 RepID=A0A6V8MI75_9BACT|nr:MBL fold metallo-hydrolase [Geomonas silvestris]GFO59658.1 ribonuclease Z [Geomonas silvestris]